MTLASREATRKLLETLADQAAVAEAVRVSVVDWPERLTGIAMQGQMGAPDWSLGELRVWELGEDLRLLMKARKWRGPGPILDLAAEVLKSKKAGKGRQTFALLIGEFGVGHYAECLATALDDPDIRGHALKAMLKAKARGYSTQVSNVVETTDGWVRRAALRYLKAFPHDDLP